MVSREAQRRFPPVNTLDGTFSAEEPFPLVSLLHLSFRQSCSSLFLLSCVSPSSFSDLLVFFFFPFLSRLLVLHRLSSCVDAGPATWAMATSKPDIMIILLSKLVEEGDGFYKVLHPPMSPVHVKYMFWAF